MVLGLSAAIDRPLGHAILNLGRGQPVALADFIEELEHLAGAKANLTTSPRPESEMLTTYASTERLERGALGSGRRSTLPRGIAPVGLVDFAKP